MDDQWELKLGGDALVLEGERGGFIDILIHDGMDGSDAGVCATPDEAMRIAYELLRRSGKATTQILDLIAERLPAEHRPVDPRG